MATEAMQIHSGVAILKNLAIHRYFWGSRFLPPLKGLRISATSHRQVIWHSLVSSKARQVSSGLKAVKIGYA